MFEDSERDSQIAGLGRGGPAREIGIGVHDDIVLRSDTALWCRMRPLGFAAAPRQVAALTGIGSPARAIATDRAALFCRMA
jgi:hypothetical protein